MVDSTKGEITMENAERQFCERQAVLLLRLAGESTQPELRTKLTAMADEWTAMAVPTAADRPLSH
jgi:hypothetical protein